MGILTGSLTASRFRVDGKLPEGWRDDYRTRLMDHAFREPPKEMGKEELEGWVLVPLVFRLESAHSR